MSDLRWHIDVQGRDDRELRDKIAVADQNAINQGWDRIETGQPTAAGDTQNVHLVYAKMERGEGFFPWWVLPAVVVLLLAMFVFSRL